VCLAPLPCPAQGKDHPLCLPRRHGHRRPGEKNVELLYEKGLIRHFEDIYRLKKDDLLVLPRFAEKSANNLIAAIEKSKHATLARFLFAIGILHVGEYAAKLLARNFRRLEDLYLVKKETVLNIKQVGEKIAASVSAFFNDRKTLELLDSMKKFGLNLSNPDFTAEKKGDLPLEGLTFVITGTLPRMRKEVEALIESYGDMPHLQSLRARTIWLQVKTQVQSLPGQKAWVKTISYDTLVEMTQNKKKQPSLFE